MTTALLVTYVWPPTGGVGATRVLKLCKYLPAHGVTPTVLTVENPSVPLRDESTLRDVRADTEVLRARTLEPSYAAKRAVWQASNEKQRGGGSRRLLDRVANIARHALVPDPQILWQPAAQGVLAKRLLSSRADDVLFITAPPFSAFLSAPLARALSRTAVVLDYRDEWITVRTHFEMQSGLNRWLGEHIERHVLKRAHMVTTATNAFRENLLRVFPFLDPARVVTIENGYDPDDFRSDLPSPPRNRMVITYAGTVLVQNSPRGFLEAVRLVHEREPELARLLEVEFIGRIVETEERWFEGSERFGVKRRGYIEKSQVAHALAASHLVLCVLDEMPGTERILPAKIFELMLVNRPVLTLAPEGELSELVRKHALGTVLPPRDSAAIAAELERCLRLFRAGELPTRGHPSGIERFDRRRQAGVFAEIFRDAVAIAHGRHTRPEV